LQKYARKCRLNILLWGNILNFLFRFYHGDIDGETAKSRLSGSSSGAFLIRLSSNERNCLTLSKKEDSGHVSHRRILKTKDKGYVISLSTKSSDVASSHSLLDLLRKYDKKLCLTSPCATGSRFAALFLEETPTSDESYVGPVSAQHLKLLAERSKKMKLDKLRGKKEKKTPASVGKEKASKKSSKEKGTKKEKEKKKTTPASVGRDKKN